MDLPLERLELSIIKKELKKRRLIKQPYLEAGCGDGFNLEKFSSLGMKGTGIDISEEALEIARKKNLQGVFLVSGNFLSYNTTNPLGIIFLLNTLEHTVNDMSFLKKASMLLQKGGYLVIAVPANSRAYGFADYNAGHIRRYNKEELTEKLRNAGFFIDACFSVGFPVNRFYTFLFNFLNKNRIRKARDIGGYEKRTAQSGIRHSRTYYPGIFNIVSKIAFPVLSILIQIDRLFIKTDLGNNLVVFARKEDGK